MLPTALELARAVALLVYVGVQATIALLAVWAVRPEEEEPRPQRWHPEELSVEHALARTRSGSVRPGRRTR